MLVIHCLGGNRLVYTASQMWCRISSTCSPPYLSASAVIDVSQPGDFLDFSC